MKKIELESQKSGYKDVFEIFNVILEESGFDLNQFVKGDSLEIPNEMSEKFLDSLKNFVSLVPDVVKQMEDAASFWSQFEKLDDYESNHKFVLWLRKYAESIIRPFEEASFLKEMDEQTFYTLTNYCFENLVLKDIGKKRIDKEICDTKQMLILKKIMFTFIEMIVVDNLSKENAFDKMKRIFGIKEVFCGIWWDLIAKNEDKIWRIMIMKQYRRVENKLNYLLEILED